MREIELRPRQKVNVSDPYATTYKVYFRGRLRGAIIPIPEDPDGCRWEAVDLSGTLTRWRNRDRARDHLCSAPDTTRSIPETRG